MREMGGYGELTSPLEGIRGSGKVGNSPAPTPLWGVGIRGDGEVWGVVNH